MFEITAGTLFVLITTVVSGFIFSKILPKSYLEGKGTFTNLAIFLSLGWPFLLAINSAFSFFYLGPFILVLIFFIGGIFAVKDLAKKPKLSIVKMPKIGMLNLFIFSLLVSASIIISIEFLSWPPIGDVATGHGPRTALFMLNQKVPIYPSPYLILYPPGFSALCATFSLTLGTYAAVGVFEVAGAILVSLVFLIGLIASQITRNSLISIIPVIFIFVPSPDLNLTRWAFGHLLNGTYPNLLAYLLLLSLFYFLAIYHLQGGWSYTRLFLILVIFGFGVLFTYPAFLSYFALFSLLPILLTKGPRSILISSIRYWLSPTKRNAILAMLVLSIAAALLLLRASIMGFISSSYLIKVLFGYLSGSYVLNGANFFDIATHYALPFTLILSDYRNLFLFAVVAIFVFSAIKRRYDYELTVCAALIIMLLASFIPMLSGISWLFVSDRAMAFVQLLAICLFCRYLILLPKHLQWNQSLLGNKISFNKWRPNWVLPIFLIVVTISSAVILNAYVYDNARAMVDSHNSYFPDDLKAMEYAEKAIPSIDLILGDGSFSSQFIMSMAIKNLSCFDQYRVSNPNLYFGGERYWNNPQDLLYLYDFITSANISYVLSMSEPMRITVNPNTGGLTYTMKPYTPSFYVSALDDAPFLKKIFQSGESCIYQVDKEIQITPTPGENATGQDCY